LADMGRWLGPGRRAATVAALLAASQALPLPPGYRVIPGPSATLQRLCACAQTRSTQARNSSRVLQCQVSTPECSNFVKATPRGVVRVRVREPLSLEPC
jgi:hypothetical protein